MKHRVKRTMHTRKQDSLEAVRIKRESARVERGRKLGFDFDPTNAVLFGTLAVVAGISLLVIGSDSGESTPVDNPGLTLPALNHTVTYEGSFPDLANTLCPQTDYGVVVEWVKDKNDLDKLEDIETGYKLIFPDCPQPIEITTLPG